MEVSGNARHDMKTVIGYFLFGVCALIFIWVVRRRKPRRSNVPSAKGSKTSQIGRRVEKPARKWGRGE